MFLMRIRRPRAEKLPASIYAQACIPTHTKGAGKGLGAKTVHFADGQEEVENADPSRGPTIKAEEHAEPALELTDAPNETFEVDGEEQLTDEEWLQRWMTGASMYSETDLTWYNRGGEISECEVLADQENIFAPTSTRNIDEQQSSFLLAETARGKEYRPFILSWQSICVT